MQITEDFKDLVTIAIREDLGESNSNKTKFIGDITTQSTIDPTKIISPSFITRESGVICGVDAARYIFERISPNVKFVAHYKDGQKISLNDKIITLSGSAQEILQSERIALNFMSHLSGIASNTAKFIEVISHTKAQILDTRKTLPGWRHLQKYAVQMGGGRNHRMGLYDMVLIKDNHIASVGSVTETLNKVKIANPNAKIEIEVDSIRQLQEVLDHGSADIVLLDNMRGDELKKAVEMSQGRIKTEASGGIDFKSVKEIAETGVDYISIGALTHSVKTLDIGLDIV